MTTTKRTSRKNTKTAASTEHREIEWAKLLDEALTTPGSVGTVYSRFYSYSFLNCMLLLVQGARGPVATYGRWQELGRQVRKGEKAKEIVRPITVKVSDDDDAEERFIQKFKFVKAIFDVSQTDGDELPDVELPEWNLDAALASLEITRVPFAELNGNIQGYSVDRQIAVSPVAVFPVKTTFHELAHIVLGHTAGGTDEDYVSHRGTKEFQAEATAYLVLKELGQLSEAEANVSRGYLQGWLGTNQPTDTAIRQVFSAVNKILQAGRPAVEAEQAAA